MYFVTKSVVPPEHAALWAWVIGWMNLLGQGAGVASVTYTVGQMILATVTMNSETNEVMETYAYTPYVPSHLPIYLETNPFPVPRSKSFYLQ